MTNPNSFPQSLSTVETWNLAHVYIGSYGTCLSKGNSTSRPWDISTRSALGRPLRARQQNSEYIISCMKLSANRLLGHVRMFLESYDTRRVALPLCKQTSNVVYITRKFNDHETCLHLRTLWKIHGSYSRRSIKRGVLFTQGTQDWTHVLTENSICNTSKKIPQNECSRLLARMELFLRLIR